MSPKGFLQDTAFPTWAARADPQEPEGARVRALTALEPDLFQRGPQLHRALLQDELGTVSSDMASSSRRAAMDDARREPVGKIGKAELQAW